MVGGEWYFLCILPASPWPGTRPSSSSVEDSPGLPGRAQRSEPRLSSSCSVCLGPFRLHPSLEHAAAEDRGLQRSMEESHPEAFFRVHSALAPEHATSLRRPLGQPRAGPPPSAFSFSVSGTQLGGCGPFPVSSFHHKSGVHPGTVAPGGSSVSGGGVATPGPFLPGSGRGPGLGVGIGRGWRTRVHAPSVVHKQRDPRVSRARSCSVLGVATSTAPALLRGEARGRMAQPCTQRGVCARAHGGQPKAAVPADCRGIT